jgi:hypothetical protein
MRTLLAIGLVLAAGTMASAATPPPTAPPRINVEDLQPKVLAPSKPLHVELTVEINKFGQVARVRDIKASHDQAFDAHTYGNALQAFIRTPDGHVVVGTYRLIYDYDPKTLRVKRDVALVSAGGVDPNAKGAADEMEEIARRQHDKENPHPGIGVTPNPRAPNVKIERSPDPTPAPSH